MLTKILFPVLLYFLLVSCNNLNEKDNTVYENETIDAQNINENEKLFADLNLPVKEFSINPLKEARLKVESGTEIFVPSSAFLDKNGKEPKNQVILKYKEIRSPSDIIIENIDMTYDSAGAKYQFQTAGMFELRAFSENQELYLQKGKKITVSYISDKPGNYNYYKYDNGWKFRETTKAEISLDENTREKTNVLTLKPVKADLSNDLIIDIKTKHNQFDELKAFKNLLWKYNGELTKDEVANLLSSEVFNPELVFAGKSGQYIYRFKTNSGFHELPVCPVFSPKAYQKAISDYESKLLKSKPIVKIKRTINVSELGLMNYDRIYHRSDARKIIAEFKVNNQKISGLPLFHITGEDDVVVRVDKMTELTYSPELNNKFIAVLPGKKIAVMNTKSFLEAVGKAKPGQPVGFNLNEIENPVNSPADLDNIISGLE
ncbi:MAG: hypothetical protein U0W24_03400 [Bacteroidales bacterium]